MNRPKRVNCFFQLYRLCCKYPNNNQQGQNNNSVTHNNTEYAMRMQRHHKKEMKLYNHNTSFFMWALEWDIVTAVQGEAGKLRHTLFWNIARFQKLTRQQQLTSSCSAKQNLDVPHKHTHATISVP
ncbi:hypothetical protein ACA910_019697 [Epithemia clementina (nom. ined.)]